eukprot:scaffold26606_cov124-Isochrysis_galbana.AAC.8
MANMPLPRGRLPRRQKASKSRATEPGPPERCIGIPLSTGRHTRAGMGGADALTAATAGTKPSGTLAPTPMPDEGAWGGAPPSRSRRATRVLRDRSTL